MFNDDKNYKFVIDQKHNLQVQKNHADICNKLVVVMNENKNVNSDEVQALIARHYNEFLKVYHNFDKFSYLGLSDQYLSVYKEEYSQIHEKLPEYLVEGMKFFAKKL